MPGDSTSPTGRTRTRRATSGRCVSTAKQTRTGPASPRRSVCAPGRMTLSLYRRPCRRAEFNSVLQEILAMWFTSRVQHRNQRRIYARERRFVPRLESLEDRTALSTLTVLNNLDSGAGSLRDAIVHAKNGDTINFAPSLDGQTIT